MTDDVLPGQSGYLSAYGVKVTRVDSIDKLMDLKRWAGERRDGRGLAIDTETTGLRPDFDTIRYIQIGDKKHGWAIPWGGWWAPVLELVNRYEGDYIFHNAKYDIRMMQSNGYEWTSEQWSRTHDTMTLAHLDNPLRPKGLKPLAARLVDPQAIAAQRVLDDAMAHNKWTWETVPMDFKWFWVYAAMDTVLTAHNFDHLYSHVNDAAYDLEMGTTRVVAKMEQRGVRIDVDYTRRKMNELLEYATSARQWLSSTHKISNPTRDQLIKFFSDNNVEMPRKNTPSGVKSNNYVQAMDKDVLQGIDHPVAQTTLAIRKAEKLVGPYFKNFLELRDSDDRIHPNVWTMGTRTARMSITDPALQTLPKRDTTVRSAFIPSEGMALVSCDYAQIEARLMTHFAHSEGMRAAFLSDEDFFCVIASNIFGKPIGKKDAERQLTKNTVYGKMYFAGVEKMAETAGVTYSTMAGVNSSFDAQFPEVRRTMDEIVTVGHARRRESGDAYVITPLGRKLMADKGQEYALVNYLIQSTAAEIFKKALVALDTVLPDSTHLLLPIHDEALLETPIEEAPETLKLVQEVMTDKSSFFVPIEAEGSWTTKTWGDLVG